MMKTRTLLGALLVLTMILFAGCHPVSAASPMGEVKTVGAGSERGIPIPYIELAHGLDYMGLLYDPLVGCTPEGRLSPDLGLANKWEMSRDGLTWTFYLRKGVKFHDGVELTAKDVKFSIEQVMGPDPDVNINRLAYIRTSVKTVDVKDAYTIIIRCKRPAIFLANALSNIESSGGMVVPKDYWERVGKDEFSKHPIGSGPYKWHSQVVGSFIKLEATDKHWRVGVPKYKYMTFLIIPEESTRIAMLKTGEADIARISRGAVKEALSAGMNIVTKDNAAVVYLTTNMQWTSPAFSDIRFRKALNLAIDQEAIIKHLFAGLATPIATYPGSSISAVGGDPKLKPYPFDAQEARRLIKEGGWEGHEFTLISYPRGGCPEYPLVVEALAGYWQKIGLKPKIRVTEFAIWMKTMEERKTQNTISGADDSLNPDVPTLIQKFQQHWYPAYKSGRTTVNIPELNERFDRIEKSMDISEISKLLAEIYRYSYDQYLLIPICEISEKIATTQRIPKWDPGIRRMDRNYNDLIKQ